MNIEGSWSAGLRFFGRKEVRRRCSHIAKAYVIVILYRVCLPSSGAFFGTGLVYLSIAQELERNNSISSKVILPQTSAPLLRLWNLFYKCCLLLKNR